MCGCVVHLQVYEMASHDLAFKTAGGGAGIRDRWDKAKANDLKPLSLTASLS